MGLFREREIKEVLKFLLCIGLVVGNELENKIE